MAIDDPVDAVQSQFKKPAENPLSLVLFGCRLAFPHASPLFDLLGILKDRFSAKAIQERMEAFWAALRDQQKFLEADFEKLRVEVNDLAEALQLATLRDAEAFDDEKRDRYLAILGNAVRSEDQISDLTTFVRDVEQLGERDVAVLKVLNIVMNKGGDWRPAESMQLGSPAGYRSSVDKPISVHPSVFVQRSQELVVQIAHALGAHGGRRPNQIPQFSREEGYSLCSRLQGFGLAHEVQIMEREVPHGNYCFRPSHRGLMLLKLLGEEVPNWQYYFPRPKPQP